MKTNYKQTVNPKIMQQHITHTPYIV